MLCTYKKQPYRIVIANFEEALLALDDGSGVEDTDDLTWVRCESVILTNHKE